MRYAIFSDIHNNHQALHHVLRDTDQRQVDYFYCLGDVGVETCVKLVQERSAPTVFGNWESSNWHMLSRQGQQWALNLPPLIKRPDFWLTHAAPFWPPSIASLDDFRQHNYFVRGLNPFPYLHQDEKALFDTMATLLEANCSLMFHGHTHRQLIFQFTANNQLVRQHQRTVTVVPGEPLVVGVGSVGQPRDGRWPSYAIYDDAARQVELIRVQ